MYFSAATISGAFSGLLAAVISDVNGVGSKQEKSALSLFVGCRVMTSSVPQEKS